MFSISFIKTNKVLLAILLSIFSVALIDYGIQNDLYESGIVLFLSLFLFWANGTFAFGDYENTLLIVEFNENREVEKQIEIIKKDSAFCLHSFIFLIAVFFIILLLVIVMDLNPNKEFMQNIIFFLSIYITIIRVFIKNNREKILHMT